MGERSKRVRGLYIKCDTSMKFLLLRQAYHARTCTCMHTCTHTRTCTQYPQAQAHAHAHRCTHAYAHIHAHTQMCMHAAIHAGPPHMHTYMWRHVLTCTRMRVWAWHAHVHTCTWNSWMYNVHPQGISFNYSLIVPQCNGKHWHFLTATRVWTMSSQGKSYYRPLLSVSYGHHFTLHNCPHWLPDMCEIMIIRKF